MNAHLQNGLIGTVVLWSLAFASLVFIAYVLVTPTRSSDHDREAVRGQWDRLVDTGVSPDLPPQPALTDAEIPRTGVSALLSAFSNSPAETEPMREVAEPTSAPRPKPDGVWALSIRGQAVGEPMSAFGYDAQPRETTSLDPDRRYYAYGSAANTYAQAVRRIKDGAPPESIASLLTGRSQDNLKADDPDETWSWMFTYTRRIAARDPQYLLHCVSQYDDPACRPIWADVEALQHRAALELGLPGP